MTEDPEKPSVWYKLICQHCDDDGYISYVCKPPILNVNLQLCNGEEFEIIPVDEHSVRIRHKCNVCKGLKYYLYCSDGWKLEKVHPKQEKH